MDRQFTDLHVDQIQLCLSLGHGGFGGVQARLGCLHCHAGRIHCCFCLPGSGIDGSQAGFQDGDILRVWTILQPRQIIFSFAQP